MQISPHTAPGTQILKRHASTEENERNKGKTPSNPHFRIKMKPSINTKSYNGPDRKETKK